MDVLGLLDVPLWLIVVLTVGSLFYYFTKSCYSVFDKVDIKGPKPWPLLGNMTEFMTKGFVEAERNWFSTYGRVFGIYEGTQPLLMVGDLDMLKEITVKEFNNFTNRRPFGLRDAAPPASDFLTILADDGWRHNRNSLTPAFSGGKLKRMDGFITKACDSLVGALKRKADNREQINIKKFMAAYTMQVIASTSFGIELDPQNVPDEPFVKYAYKFFDISLFSPSFILAFICPSLVPYLTALKISFLPEDSVRFFRSIIKQALEERRKKSGKYHDFLQLMADAEKQAENASEMNGKDTSNDDNFNHTNVSTPHDVHWIDKRKGKGLTDDEILAASIVFFTAGFDTTANPLSYVIYHLALNPTCQEKLRSEIDENFPQGKQPSYETVNKLTYLEMVLMETLRINPPIARMDRECKQDTVIKGVRIPAGTGVALPIYSIHHNPAYWPDPEVFDPERFTPEKREKHHPLQWIPFGYGPRNCIGMRLALFEIKLAVVHLIRNFRFVPNSKTAPLKFGTTVLLGVKEAWVTVEHRA